MSGRIDKTSTIDEHQVNVDHCFFDLGRSSAEQTKTFIYKIRLLVYKG